MSDLIVDSPVEIAKNAVEQFINFGTISAIPEDILSQELRLKSAAFVCLKKHGELRGCIGTLEPEYVNLATEIQTNAVSAAINDPRFNSVIAEELTYLVYSVDILRPAVEVKDISKLNPNIYGVIVEAHGRRGVLLPDLEGVDTVEKQLTIAASKAGIILDVDVKISAFEVVRYPLK